MKTFTKKNRNFLLHWKRCEMFVYCHTMHFATSKCSWLVSQEGKLSPIWMWNLVECLKNVCGLLFEKEKANDFCTEFLRKMNNWFLTPVPKDWKHGSDQINPVHPCCKWTFMAGSSRCISGGAKRIYLINLLFPNLSINGEC